ncbi:MAG: hypothetical protein Q9157_003224 [Trypethelium eluteriae]
MRASLTDLCLLLTLPSLSLAFPSTNYANLQVHDPAIVQNSGKYYAFSTGGLLNYWKADSISGPWAHQGTVFSSAPNINNPGKTDLWAPDLHQVNGLYYLYYAASNFGSQTSVIGLATSSSLNVGSWTDHGAVISSPGSTSPYTITNAIDPNLIVTPSGSAYLNWGSFWADIWQVPLQSGLATPGSAYKIIVGRSTSVTGPFLDQSGKDMAQGGGTTIMGSNGNVYAPGGQGVVTAADGTDILYYHYCESTCICEV